MTDLYLALVHHPVLDKNGQVVTTAVTNMDLHDIARSARTYGVRKFFVVTPVRALRALSERIIEHWMTGHGSTYNPTRTEALALIDLEPDLDAVQMVIERQTGLRPVVVVTSARQGEQPIRFSELRERVSKEKDPHLVILGTGWGLTPELLDDADLRLEPICGIGEYNHLSVRAAAAIILDRLRGTR